MTILIITKSDDVHTIPLVTHHVTARGGEVFRFDTDRYPTEVRVDLEVSRGSIRGQIQDGERILDLAEVTGIWYRRLDVAARLPMDMNRQLREASFGESRAMVHGLIAALADGVFTLDPPHVIDRAKSKELQLRIAREVGLDVPRSLTTNNPDAVRRFYAECPGEMIAKMLSSFAVYEGGVEKVVFTNRVTAEQLADLDGLDLCPMTFQELLPKVVELRVTIVGHRVFTAAVDSKVNQLAEVDWRRDGIGLLDAWKPYPLPADVERSLLALMDRLDLNYGAADIIVTPDGRHVFLEVNPAGEWFWLDDPEHRPIGECLAELLTGNGRRIPHPGSIRPA
jgi:glutathione synthase/RimK-type ligase-like ATP-grasp enzyme